MASNGTIMQMINSKPPMDVGFSSTEVKDGQVPCMQF
jgi:hypothetical protein